MYRPILWIASAAIFSIIGMVAARLEGSINPVAGAFFGAVGGLVLAAIAVAGEKRL